MSLTLDPQIVEQATGVTKEQLKQFEKEVPTFTKRPTKKILTSYADHPSTNLAIISFDTETTCGGKEAEIIQLAAQNELGKTFSRFVLPTKDISFHASRINKFQLTTIGGKKILHRGGIRLETVSQAECLESFVNFIAASKDQNNDAKVILIGHNSCSFDTPVFLRTVLRYSPHLIPEMKALNVHFADSLAFVRKLIREKCEALKTEDGSFVKPNQAAIYRILFNGDFEGHDALEDVKKPFTKFFYTLLLAPPCAIL